MLMCLVPPKWEAPQGLNWLGSFKFAIPSYQLSATIYFVRIQPLRAPKELNYISMDTDGSITSSNKIKFRNIHSYVYPFFHRSFEPGFTCSVTQR